MKIELTKEQYEELLTSIAIGSYIRGGVADMKGEKYDDSKLMEHLLGYAKEIGLEKLTDKFHGRLIQGDKFSEKVEKIMEQYDEDEFWSSLITYLGKRDFVREATKEELAEIEKDEFGWLPKKIQEYYAKYEKEFEKYGIERLEINEKSKGIE